MGAWRTNLLEQSPCSWLGLLAYAEPLPHQVIKGNWGIAKDKAAQQVSLEKVQSYEEAFERIKQATGITEIDQLVSTFIHAEEQNFSLFNYVTGTHYPNSAIRAHGQPGGGGGGTSPGPLLI